MSLHETAEIAMKAGEILLSSGAEIYRVEETIIRICKSFDIKCETVVLPTGIFLTAEDAALNTVSMTKRIKYRTVDLHKIELLNDFSRNLADGRTGCTEALEQLVSIGDTRSYAFILRLMASGIAGFVFTMLFRGSYFDGVASFAAGMLMAALKELIARFGFFQFFELFICGVASGFTGICAVIAFPSLDLYKIIIGTITIFLPGVAITNGIKDALHGDLISSLGRLGEAVFIVTAIGAGVGLAISIGLRWT